ncbi:MAG: type I-F CRISPR-associated endoribonuclease Cas6/Csy4 [Proteobacteria bacterium]|nr:MAG: type I-F CRISPR-associated endoribonuclease Cas6/Csy4 [Pseudomonadota bacterium]
MYYFIELSLIPDESISPGFVMSKVMDVLHLCFVNVQKALGYNPVGLAFPEYRYGVEGKRNTLGTKIRLYAQNEAHLETLSLKQQLRRFEDYVHLRAIREDEAKLGFACFKRVQFRSSVERLARRRMAYVGETLEQSKQHFQGFVEQTSDLPFAHLHSQSSEQSFRLFIAKQAVPEPTDKWQFSSYGLSATVGVPST